MSESIQLPSPLASRFLTDGPAIGGRLKVRPEDFVVEEIPSYEPCGEGEHLYLGIQKVGVSHGELLTVLQRHFGVTLREIGYAGMKDKRAVTRQVVSLHLRDEPRDMDIPHDRISVIWADRHRNKLRRGHLVGNRFSIRIRDVEPVHAPTVLRVLRQLESEGMPAWYGEQRFGYRHNNHVLGRYLLRREHEAAARELAGTTGSVYPAYQQERRELFDAGRYAEALAQWTAADRAELIVCRALSRGESWERAIRAIGQVTLNFWTSALASAAFNRVVDRRIEDGTHRELLEGDLAWKHDSRAVFAVTPHDAAGPEMRTRYDAFEISPTGPLWGDGMAEPGHRIRELEAEALADLGTEPRDLETGPWRPEGRRRPFRDTLENPDVEGGFDDHGPYIRCAFDLRRGMYATMVLREVMRVSATPAGAEEAAAATASKADADVRDDDPTDD